MPRVEKATIGGPMALTPRVTVNPLTPPHHPRTLPRHSSAHERAASHNPQAARVVDISTTQDGQFPHANGHRRTRAPSHAPFPSMPSNGSPPTMKPPANTPRSRFYSETARLPLTPLSVNDPFASVQHHPIELGGVECSASLIDEGFHIFSDFTTLLTACKDHKVFTFSRLCGIFLISIDKALRKLDTYPEFLRKSAMVVAAKGSVEFSKQVIRNFADSLARDGREENKQATSVHMASLAILVWDSVRVLMRVSYQEELYHNVVKELGPGEEAPRSSSETAHSDTQEVTEVASILKKSLVASSSDSSKAVKASILDYFHGKTKLTKSRKPRLDRSVQQVDANASRTVFTRRTVDSFILVENKPPSLCEDPRDIRPFDPCDHIPDIKEARRRTGLHESHIFFAAASTLVTTPFEQDFDVHTYRTQWVIPISESEIVRESKRDTVTGSLREVISGATFPALVQVVLEKIDVPDSADFVDTFFLFFRLHSRPSAFLDMLIATYEQVSPATRAFQRSSFRAYRKYGKMQVIKVIRMWLDSHWEEKHDHTIRESLFKFVNDVVRVDRDFPDDVSSSLQSAMARRQVPAVEARMSSDRHQYPITAFQKQVEYMEDMVSRGHDVSLIDIVVFNRPGGAEEIARGLTILESEYFLSFPPKEIVALRTGHEPKKFREWEKFNTAMGWWVLDSVLSHKGVEGRIKAIELFINVAHICMRTLQNYSSAQTIVHALNQNALSRLQGTLPLISSGHKNRMRIMDDIFWGVSKYQAAIKMSQPAVPVPYMIRFDLNKVSRACTGHTHRRTKDGERMVDMNYYFGVRRYIRDLENVHTELPIPRVKVILQWLETVCKRYLDVDHEDVRMKMMAKSFVIEEAKANPLQRRRSWVTEENRKEAYLQGYLP
ncbi:hypothetical protein EUX98_g6612 [Antrodiella citrinella]|uniref:Ras-GEF domain-containing protein n=1 Tax=Antrodiella citrinella TaxID=2447956 RepID=A0A4S4MR32_9APHY|nr:hypothetical protein EUX98_g6612 [Antrodiella citrinella]